MGAGNSRSGYPDPPGPGRLRRQRAASHRAPRDTRGFATSRGWPRPGRAGSGGAGAGGSSGGGGPGGRARLKGGGGGAGAALWSGRVGLGLWDLVAAQVGWFRGVEPVGSPQTLVEWSGVGGGRGLSPARRRAGVVPRWGVPLITFLLSPGAKMGCFTFIKVMMILFNLAIFVSAPQLMSLPGGGGQPGSPAGCPRKLG